MEPNVLSVARRRNCNLPNVPVLGHCTPRDHLEASLLLTPPVGPSRSPGGLGLGSPQCCCLLGEETGFVYWGGGGAEESHEAAFKCAKSRSLH